MMKHVRIVVHRSVGIYAEKGGRDYPGILTNERKLGIGSLILLSVWRQVQSEFLTECELMLPLPISSTFSHP